jgi:hypothetical protein
LVGQQPPSLTGGRLRTGGRDVGRVGAGHADPVEFAGEDRADRVDRRFVEDLEADLDRGVPDAPAGRRLDAEAGQLPGASLQRLEVVGVARCTLHPEGQLIGQIGRDPGLGILDGDPREHELSGGAVPPHPGEELGPGVDPRTDEFDHRRRG